MHVATASSARVHAGQAALTRLLLAAGIFLFAFEHGGYATSERTLVGAVVWWFLLLGVVAGVVCIGLTRAGIAAIGGLVTLCLLDLVSQVWSHDASSAFAEFDRVLVYVGVLLVAVAIATSIGAAALVDGIALGIVAIALTALVSRLDPSLGASRLPAVFQKIASNRLSYPLDYWNGLAIFVALAFPLLLHRASAVGSAVVRAAAMLPFPVLGAVLYLTSSRGGVAVAVLGTIVFVAATASRWDAAASAVLGVAGAALGGGVVAHYPRLNHVVAQGGTGAAGRHAAVLIAAVCVATATVQYALARLQPFRAVPRIVGVVVVAAAAILIVIGLVEAHPVAKMRAFISPASPQTTSLRTHLLNANGNGRWQQWTAAVREWESKPIYGRGAGSYYRWWLQHGSIPLQVRNAHSLYLETLGELGVFGFAALVLALGAGLVAAVRKLRVDRGLTAAVFAAYVAFLGALAIDWMWQLAAVGAVGIALLGILVAGPPPASSSSRWEAVLAVVAVGAALAMLLGFLPARWLGQSYAAAAARRSDDALRYAADAERLQPWATAPRLQIALLQESLGDLSGANATVGKALRDDPGDWQLWLVRTRLALERGRGKEARRALERAAQLNPQSNLFFRLHKRLG